MKRRGIMGMLLLGLLLMGITACGSDGKETTSQQPTESYTNVTITADGNIEALSHARLTFGSGGKVGEIAVKKGDRVNKGDVLARLETDTLEVALTQAKVAQAEAKVAVSQAKAGITQAQAGVTQAEMALQTAKYNLNQTQSEYSLKDIKAAEGDVAITRRDLEEVFWTLSKYEPGSEGWLSYQRVVIFAQTRANNAEDRLDAILSGGDSEQVAIKKLQVEAAQQSVELAKQTLDIAEQSLSLAEQSLEFTRQSVELAQKQLEEATITAPFDGIIYEVGVKEGEFLSPAVFSGTTIVGIVDLSHMELVARIDEPDIAKVKAGQKVMISVDAVPEAKLEGRVTFISPVAREPVGVVLFEDEDEEQSYEVKIDFDIPENSLIRAGMSATAEIIVE